MWPKTNSGIWWLWPWTICCWMDRESRIYMAAVCGEKYRVCSLDVSNGWCIRSIPAAEWRRNNFDCIKEAQCTAFAADSFTAYEQFVVWCLYHGESVDVFLVALQKLSSFQWYTRTRSIILWSVYQTLSSSSSTGAGSCKGNIKTTTPWNWKLAVTAVKPMRDPVKGIASAPAKCCMCDSSNYMACDCLTWCKRPAAISIEESDFHAEFNQWWNEWTASWKWINQQSRETVL